MAATVALAWATLAGGGHAQTTCTVPDLAAENRTAVWDATMTVAANARGHLGACGSCSSELSPDTFQLGSHTYTVRAVLFRTDLGRLTFTLSPGWPTALERARLTLHVCDESYPLKVHRSVQWNATTYDDTTSVAIRWDAELDWAVGDSIGLRLSMPSDTSFPAALVSNFNEQIGYLGGFNPVSTNGQAMSFQTGGNAGGYVLDNLATSIEAEGTTSP